MIATTLAEREDDGVAERAVDTTESAVIRLDPELAAAGVHPAIVSAECRVSNEDALREPGELEAVRKLRDAARRARQPRRGGLPSRADRGLASNAELLAGL